VESKERIYAQQAPSKRGGHQVRQFMGTWANHVQSWVGQQLIPVLLLRYEDLLANPNAEFTRLAHFIDLPTDEALISEATANTRFDKLRAKEEEEGGFREKPEGCERFFRSGRSGEGREQLTAEQILQLEKAFSETLIRFGYGLNTSVTP
jgi:aryl sulfotransferase